MKSALDIYQHIRELQEQGVKAVLITVAACRGSNPADPGAKALVTEGGLFTGSVGGGKIEAYAVKRAVEFLREDALSTALETVNLQRDIGMTCGGEMTLLFEGIEPKTSASWHIVVFGAGHVSAALMRVLSTLPCHVDLVDPREEWLGKIPNYPNVVKHLPQQYEEMVGLVSKKSQVLCISQGHATDLPILSAILRGDIQPAYLGVIGSAAKRAVLKRELLEEGCSPERFQDLICPIGLPIGDNTPPQIALSISAQLLEEFENR